MLLSAGEGDGDLATSSALAPPLFTARATSHRDCRNLVVLYARHGEVQDAILDSEGHRGFGVQEFYRSNVHAGGQLHPHLLRTERIHRAHPSMLRIRVGVVQQMDGVSRRGLPCEHLDESVAIDLDNGFVEGDPAQRVVQKAQQVAVAGEPEGALDVSGEIGDAALADFAQNDGWLVGVRLGGVGEFRRIIYESGNDREQRILQPL